MGKVIGFDGSRAFAGGRTGTENYSFEVLKALAKIDKENKYIVYVRPNSFVSPFSVIPTSSVIPTKVGIHKNKFSGSPIRSGMTTEGDEIQWSNNFQFKVINWPRLWTQGGLALQTFKDNLDVLFVPAHTLPLIRKPGLKTVVTVHDLGSEYLPSMHQLKQRFYLGLMQRFQLKTATKIIAVSKATKEDLVKRLGIDEKKIKVVYEGINEKLKFQSSNFKSDVVVNTLMHYNLQSKTYFLFVGTVQPRKNLERLIKAFSLWLLAVGKKSEKQIANSKQLIIVGSEGWLSDDIYELPKKLGIEDKVKFLGYVPDEDLPALYSGAMALTFPSLFEGFGLPILEAQALGCPVLTSNVSSMPEVAGKGAVFVNPYDIDDIVKGMIEIQNSKIKNQNIKKGFENIKRFSWEKCASETLEVLETA